MVWDFSAPLRELLMYYQIAEDVRVRYREMQRFIAGVAVQHPPSQGLQPPLGLGALAGCDEPAALAS